MRLPNLEFPFEVPTNALDRALGGVLVQEGHSVAFECRKLDATEQRYNTHEKDMIAVIHSLETWKHYLMGTWFMVVIDNVALTTKQAQW